MATHQNIAVSNPSWTQTPPYAAALSEPKNLVLDCSNVNRFGIRGFGTSSWMQMHAPQLPECVNTLSQLDCGGKIVRLGTDEFLCLESLTQPRNAIRALQSSWLNEEASPKGYDAYRQETWAWFCLAGPGAQAAMAGMTSLDIREKNFPNLSVAQTRAVHLDAVVLRSDHFGNPAYDLFFDMASKDFVSEVIADTFDSAEFVRLEGQKNPIS